MVRFRVFWVLMMGFALFAPGRGEAEDTREVDLLIVGATESGWAAAIQAARMGVASILMVHDGHWFGGQYTEQALACVDENKGVGKEGWGVEWHPMKRSFHRSGLFRELMDGIEAQNEKNYGSPMPGQPWHGPSTFRPAEAEAVFRELIQPYIESGKVEVIWGKYPVAAEVDSSVKSSPRLLGLTFAPIDLQTAESGEPDLTVKAKLTIDASDWGDAIQVSGAAYECGPDPKSRYGEPSAPEDLTDFPANEMNPITWAMIVEETESWNPIPEPPNYDLRNYPRATRTGMASFGKALNWDRKVSRYGGIAHWPPRGEEAKRQLSVFSVRRIVEGTTSSDGRTSILLNYMNGQDYPLERLPKRVCDALEATEPGASEKNLVEMTRGQRQIVFDDAKSHSLGVLHHLQTWVHDHVDDTANSFRKFRLSPEFGTPDGLPPKPYIREGLRLKAMYMMREQDGRNRDGETKTAAKERFAEVLYPDGLFAWQFHYDFHRTGRTYLEGDEGREGPWIDFEKPGRHTRFVSDRSVFPMRSLIPESMNGLLGAQGNVGFSSIVSAAIRLHDQRIHIGQAAGATAAVSLQKNVDPRDMVYERARLEEVRDGLCSEKGEGVPLLLWPFRDLRPEDPWFVALNRLAARGILSHGAEEVDFRGQEPASPEWLDAIAGPVFEKKKDGKVLIGGIRIGSRGEVAQQVWRMLSREAVGYPDRQTLNDADGDGIPDLDDALLFAANEPVTWSVQRPEPTPETDGIWPEVQTRLERRFNFSGTRSDDAEWDGGRVWDDSLGYGWQRSITKNSRRRSAYPEPYRDSFLFTRSEDTWEVKVEPGARYEVIVCIGDSGHDQPGQNVRVEGEWLFRDVDTQTGFYLEKSIEVSSQDNRLSVTIGDSKGGKNTCLVWLILRRLL